MRNSYRNNNTRQATREPVLKKHKECIMERFEIDPSQIEMTMDDFMELIREWVRTHPGISGKFNLPNVVMKKFANGETPTISWRNIQRIANNLGYSVIMKFVDEQGREVSVGEAEERLDLLTKRSRAKSQNHQTEALLSGAASVGNSDRNDQAQEEIQPNTSTTNEPSPNNERKVAAAASSLTESIDDIDMDDLDFSDVF